MKRRIPFIDTLRPFGVGLALLALVALVLIFRLPNLLPAASASEAHTIQIAQAENFTPRNIVQDSSFFAYKVGLYTLKRFDFLSLTTIRSLGVICGLIGVTGFYLLLRKWHTRRLALMGGFLFATSSWFLQASRFGVPEVMYLLLPALVYLAIKVDEGTRRLSVAIASVIIVTQLLYLPGMVWFLGAGLFWQRKRLLARLREIHSAALIVLGVLTGALLIPLAISLATNVSFWPVWLAYPLQNQTPLEFGRNFLAVPWHVFIKQIIQPEFHLGRLPLLDIATSAFVLLGLYWYFFQRKLDRAKLIVAGLLFGGLLTASIGLPAQSVLLPFVYILATGGITLMLQQWFTVFPRNPLARGVGLGLIISLVGLTSFYHMRRYFVAWPGAPETKQAYSVPSAIIDK